MSPDCSQPTGWTNLAILVDDVLVALLSDWLVENEPHASVYIENASEQEDPIFAEPGTLSSEISTENPPLWANSVAHVLMPDADQGSLEDWQQFLSAKLGVAICIQSIAYLENTDWVKKTQAQFQPTAITPGLWIVPSWHQPPEPQACNIQIDPGVGFGTGEHATTQFCLDWLYHHLKPGQTVLDYGCGSGILAITAQKLGSGRTCATDIDPQALQAARRNAEINQVNVECFEPGQQVAKASYDVVLANILAQPLIELATILAAHLKPYGCLILSGILATQKHLIISSYQQIGLQVSFFDQHGPWIALTAWKPAF